MYHFVSFCDDSGTGIISENWIEDRIDDDNNNKILVAYPLKQQYGMLPSALRNKATPPMTWETYAATIVFSHESLSKLRKKASEFSNGETTQEEEDRRRRILAPVKYGMELERRTTVTSKRSATTSEHLIRPNPDRNATCSSPVTPHEVTIDGESIIQSRSQLPTLPNLPHPSPASSAQDNPMTTVPPPENLLKAIYRKLCTISSRQRQDSERIQHLEAVINSLAGVHESSSFEFSPITNVEYEVFKREIADDPDFLDKLVSYLVSVGGNNPRDMVSRTIPKLLTNSFQK